MATEEIFSQLVLQPCTFCLFLILFSPVWIHTRSRIRILYGSGWQDPQRWLVPLNSWWWHPPAWSSSWPSPAWGARLDHGTNWEAQFCKSRSQLFLEINHFFTKNCKNRLRLDRFRIWQAGYLVIDEATYPVKYTVRSIWTEATNISHIRERKFAVVLTCLLRTKYESFAHNNLQSVQQIL